MTDEQNAVAVKDLYKTFKLPLENHSGIKQVIVNAAKRKKGYELQKVLNGISFEIKKGEFFGIVGRNGSGKSTLLKLLAGIYVPDSGLVQVNGSLTPFIELGVGFNPELTGYENVFLNGALLGFSRKEMEIMYDDIVSFAELEKFMDQKLKNYSSGMQVRLAFSIAIRAQSDILLLDEVLAVGDEAFQRKCYQYFQELKRNKKTVILVTHDMGAVERFCNRGMLINEGKIMLIGDPEEIAVNYSVLNSPDRSSLKNDKKGRKTNLNTTITNLTIDKPEIGLTHELNVTVEVSNRSDIEEKIVCGITIDKIGDQATMTHLEFNSYSAFGDSIISAKNAKSFTLTVDSGQLSKGDYIIRPHYLDVSDNYRYHGHESIDALVKVVEADISKNGSFNLRGRWKVEQ